MADEIREPALEAVARVMDSGVFLMGRELEAFEGELADWLGGGRVVGCGSGTDAVTLALMAGGVGAGDEVVVSTMVPGATVSAIVAAGARPLLVDCGDDYGVDVRALRGRDLSRVKAWVAVHLYGMMAPTFPEFLGEAVKRGWWVVEDCAQALGARVEVSGKEYRAGWSGDVGAFSFYPTKNLGAFGDAGACFVRESGPVELRIRRLRQYGWETRDDAVSVGRNSRLDEIQAAILRVSLRLLDRWISERRCLAERYAARLEREKFTGFAPWLWGAGSVFHQYVVRVRDRDAVESAMLGRGVPVGVHYRRAAHMQRAFRGYARGSFTMGAALASEVLSLPVYPGLTEEQIDSVIWVLMQEMKRR